MPLLITVLAAHGLWERFVLWRGELLSRLGPMGWLIAALLFMGMVLGLMRAAGRADNSEL